MPGPHWIPRFIQSVEIVDVSNIRSVQQKAVMLTEDENIVSISFAIQYDIKDASDYIFNLKRSRGNSITVWRKRYQRSYGTKYHGFHNY